jgi:hypothetical protein
LDQLEGTKKDEESSETKEQDKNTGDSTEKHEDTHGRRQVIIEASSVDNLARGIYIHIFILGIIF